MLRHWSIRSQLIGLALAVALPAAGLIAYGILDAARESLERSQGAVQRLAAETADELAIALRENESLLARIAQRPLVRSLDPQRCDPLIGQFVELHPEFANIGVLDRGGALICAWRPGPRRPELTVGWPWFREGIASGRFTAGDAFLGPATGRWVSVLTYTVRGDGGAAAGLVALPLDLANLQQRVLHTAFQDSVVEVFDRNRTFLMHSQAPEKWIGHRHSSEELPAEFWSQREGFVRARGVDGVPRIYAFATVGGAGWRVVAGVPEDSAFASHRQRLAGSVALGLLVLLLVAGAGWGIGRTIAAPIGELAATARAVAGGERAARAPESGAAEVAGVAREFNRMLESTQRAEQALRDTLENMAQGITLVDRDLRVVAWNRRLLTMLDFPESLYHEGTTFADVMRFNAMRGEYGPGDPEEQVRERVELAKRFEPHCVERVRPNGMVLEIRGVPLPGGGFVTTYTNITERRAAERMLEERSHFERQLLDAVPTPIFYKDEEGRYLGCNLAFEDYIGISRAEIVGKSVYDIAPKELADAYRAADAQLLANPGTQIYEAAVKYADGSRREVMFHKATFSKASGALGGLVGVILDITERKQRESTITRLGRVLDESSNEIYLFDAGTLRFVQVNEGARRNLGYTMDELRELTPLDLKPEFDSGSFARLIGPLESGERPAVSFVTSHRRKHGSLYPVEVRLQLSRSAGAPVFIAIIQDITERVEAQEKLQAFAAELERRVAERTGELEAALRELESFSYSVSHDLRAPARAMVAFSRIVIDDFGAQLPEEGRRLLARISKAGVAMGAMVDGLLELARVARRELPRAPVDLVGIAAEVWRELSAAEPGREVELHMDAEIRAEGDPVLLRNLLLNLLANARKYTRQSAAAAVWFGRAPEGELYVRDNGVGFDMQYAGKLFGTFQRLHTEREFEGYGIGLALAKKIAERHGGRIRAESSPGKGATFFFTLGPDANQART